jgi:hypothetical protein
MLYSIANVLPLQGTRGEPAVTTVVGGGARQSICGPKISAERVGSRQRIIGW